MMATTRTTAVMGNGVADNPGAVGWLERSEKKERLSSQKNLFSSERGPKKEIGEESEFGRGPAKICRA